MRLMMLGVNHRSAGVELREKLALGPEALGPALARCKAAFPSAQAVVLSTCNRTEWYLAKPTHDTPTADDLRRLITQNTGLTNDELTAASIHREQDQAAAHLFAVTAGLDAMVLGETQILGQVKRAYEAACAADTVGPALHKVFQQALATARHLHTHTGIGDGQRSIASVAVDFVGQVFERLGDKCILCIGAGPIGKLVTRHMLDREPGRILLTNRTPERARDLAQELGLDAMPGGVRPWEALDELLVEADVIITATGAREPILDVDRFKQAIRKRRGRPVFILDTAMPRDVDPAVAALRNVYLYNLDDLEPVVAQTLAGRADELERCRSLIRGEVRMCMNQIQHRDIGQLIRTLRQQLHAIGDAEHQRSQRKLATAGLAEHPILDDLLAEHTRRIINKVLHLPLSRLDPTDPEAPLGFYAAALRHLFDLPPEVSPPPPPEDSPAHAEGPPVRLAPGESPAQPTSKIAPEPPREPATPSTGAPGDPDGNLPASAPQKDPGVAST